MVDLNRFKALGVVIKKSIPNKEGIEKLIKSLNNIFKEENVTKNDVVLLMKEYLPNFEHIEAGRSLDSKM